MKYLALFTALAFASVFIPRDSSAQYGPFWEKIAQIPTENNTPIHVTCGYFWSKQEGIVGVEDKCPIGNDCGYSQLYYCEDGKWSKSIQPVVNLGGPRQIVMKDRDTGYAVFESLRAGFSEGTALKTTDRGRTWSLFSVDGEASDAVILRTGDLLYSYFALGPQIGAAPNRIRGNSIANASGTWLTVDEEHLRYSYDDGQNWGIRLLRLNPDTILHGESGLVYSSKFNTLVVAQGYTGMNGPMLSKDTGHTFTYLKDWGGTFRKKWYGTGDLRGGRDAMYAQNWTTESQRPNGFLRSTDGGYHWKDVNGPSNTYNTRFFVPGCTGATVYAFDTLGGIWYTESGGDGMMPRDIPSQPKFNNAGLISSTLCNDSSLTIPFLNDLCDNFRIDSIGLVVTDPAFDNSFYASGALTLTHSQLPRTYSTDEKDSIHVLWDPKLFLDHDTTFTRKLFVRYYSGTDGKLHDTTINVVLTAKGTNPRIAMDRDAIDFQATSTCFPNDTTVTITNTSCDTITIDKLTGRGAFDLSGITTPLRLAPEETVTLAIGFRPQSQGPEFGNVHIDATHQGIQRGFDIPLSGIGTVGEGLLELMTPSAVQLPELSICASDDTSGTVRNTGCDTIIVKNISLTGSADYTLASAITDVTLPPDSSLAFRILFTPQNKGTRTGLVTITSTDERGNNPRDITITLGADVIAGSKVLASSINAINFGETNICEERDSVVRLTNNGCDTLTITSADVDKNFSVSGSFPIVLAPNESVDVPITTIVDTTGKPNVLTGNLTFTSTADNQVVPIALTRGLSYPTKLRIEAVDNTSGSAGAIVKFRIILEGDASASMTALHFDFLHDNDLLSFEGLSSQDLRITSTTGNDKQVQSFTLSPVTQAGVLGELSFRTHLAAAEETALTFANIRFDATNSNGEPLSGAPECIAVVSDSGSRFNYIYTCGDNTIRDVLTGGVRLIKSITPNPAKNEIRVELNVDGQAEVAIFNALGAEMLRSAGDRIDVLALPDGVYYVRVGAAGSIETRRIVVTR